MENKSLFGFVFFFSVWFYTYGQKPQIEFFQQDYDAQFYEQFAHKKRIPNIIREQALTALSFFPELKDTRIIFRLRKRKTPLASRPRFTSVFLPKGTRAYVITISTESTSSLEPILFSKLPYNSQVGVLGHEISHIAEYIKKSSFQLIGLGFKISNPDFVDGFEFNTDKRTIAHGLGYQLLDWSRFVRKALNVVAWQGASLDIEEGNDPEVGQRYMNPETIEKYLLEYAIYSKK